MIRLKKFTFNPVGVNACLLWDDSLEAILFDPACFYPEEELELSRYVEENGLKIVHLLNTHGHFDHLMGNNFAMQKWNLPCRIHPEDAGMISMAMQHAAMFGIRMINPSADVGLLADGEVIRFGAATVRVIHVPGHSPGGVAFHCEEAKILISGDILFEGSVGRTDLPGGNHRQLIQGIQEKLMILDDDVTVYPGHGNKTTIGFEKRTNTFLR